MFSSATKTDITGMNRHRIIATTDTMHRRHTLTTGADTMNRRRHHQSIIVRHANNFSGGFVMSDCIFCKIANKEIDSKLIFEDDTVAAFRDMNPQAPQHILIIPKKHFSNIVEVDDKEIAAHIFVDVVPEIAKLVGVEESGFRLVINTGKDGGQTVGHLHIHLLGGRKMTWPPG